MSKQNIPRLQKLTWTDARERVAKVNLELADIIDELEPSNKFPIYIASYPYGSHIVEEGRFYLPRGDGKLAGISDSKFSDEIKADLGYADEGIPVGVILDRSMELFVKSSTRFFPWKLYSEGALFGLWRGLDVTPSYHPILLFNVSAGARTIFMLPNIGDATLHKNLKRDFNIHAPSPKTLLEQWNVFKEITQHPNLNCQWSTQLLLFSKKWLTKMQEDKAWSQLSRFFLNYSWQQTGYWRNQIFYDFAFSCAQANRNLKPNPYLADTAKHLLTMGLGAAPGFGVAVNDAAAPYKLLQKIYLESYGLKKYSPTIMHPIHFSTAFPHKAIYYSLQLPSAYEFSPKSRQLSSTLHDLSELKHIITVYLEELAKGKLKIEQTPMANLVNNAQFDYFHNKKDRHEEIRLTSEMPNEDPALLKCDVEEEQKDFADAGTFVRGCVRILR